MRKSWIIAGALIVGALAVTGNRTITIERLRKIRFTKDLTADMFVKTSTGFDNLPNKREIESLRQLAVKIIQPLIDKTGKKPTISSAFRSELVNKAVGGAENSQHRTAEAADIQFAGISNSKLIALIIELKLPFDQVIDEQLKGKAWVHVSYRASGKPRYEYLTARDNGSGGVIYKRVA